MQQPFTPVAEELLEKFDRAAKEDQVPESAPKIQVNEAIGVIVFLYEKLRTVIDYKDDHLLRKNAIKRILKRRFVNHAKSDKIAKPLVLELIRSRYLPNDKIPEYRVDQVARILDKYIYLNNEVASREVFARGKDFREWMITLAACEIDNLLVPQTRQEAIAEAMYQVVGQKMTLPPSKDLAPEIKNVQINVAIRKALNKDDDDILTFYLFQRLVPGWSQPTSDLLRQIGANAAKIKQAIDNQLNHPLRNRLFQACRKYNAPFIILRGVLLRFQGFQEAKKGKDRFELLAEERGEVEETPDSLEDVVEEVCRKKYKEAKIKIFRRAAKAVLYVFITKIILALALEIPYDNVAHGEINYLTLAINIAFPPLFVLLISLLVRVPNRKNTIRIIQGVKEIIYQDEKPIIFTNQRVSLSTRSQFFNFVFVSLYLVIFLINFSLISWVLQQIGFNVISGVIFIIIASIISFFGVSLSQSVRELRLSRANNSIFSLGFDLMTLPILRVGRWISTSFAQVNIVVYLLDNFFEKPFQSMIELFEEWISYLHEKREEIY